MVCINDYEWRGSCIKETRRCMSVLIQNILSKSIFQTRIPTSTPTISVIIFSFDENVVIRSVTELLSTHRCSAFSTEVHQNTSRNECTEAVTLSFTAPICSWVVIKYLYKVIWKSRRSYSVWYVVYHIHTAAQVIKRTIHERKISHRISTILIKDQYKEILVKIQSSYLVQ